MEFESKKGVKMSFYELKCALSKHLEHALLCVNTTYNREELLNHLELNLKAIDEVKDRMDTLRDDGDD